MKPMKLGTITSIVVIAASALATPSTASAQLHEAHPTGAAHLGPTLQDAALFHQASERAAELPGAAGMPVLPERPTGLAGFLGTAVASSLGGSIGFVAGAVFAYVTLGDDCDGCDGEYILAISAASTLSAAAGARMAGRPGGRALAGAFLGSMAGLATIYAVHDGSGSQVVTYGVVQGLVTAIVSAWPSH